jgi:bifunctional UDP-N-acetylglucosamine pyrophosphorylase / glucosamine-1-phosphate N-acetyltransferase
VEQLIIMSDLAIIILAAGKGTRMHSSKPKVLHPLAGCPWILHLIETAKLLNPQGIYVVISPENRAAIELALSGQNCHLIEQKEVLGTAHAVLTALPHIKAQNTLILLGDTPLLKSDTLLHLIKQTALGTVGLLSFEPENPMGLGRVLRDEQGNVQGVREEKDASAAEKTVREAAVGVYFAATTLFETLLPQINNQNAAGEYYLPDLLPLALQAKHAVHAVKMQEPMQGFGINTKNQLAIAERYFQRQQAEHFMGLGVTMLDPNRVDIRGKLSVKQDVVFDINIIIEGEVSIGENCSIGANTILRNVKIGDHVTIAPNSMIEDAVIDNHCVVGPFARIRPGCHIHENAHVGNFVELKKTQLGLGSKVNHLSYVGDAVVGDKVNIGAGTITCNYDGVNKHQTIIKDGAFVGSNSALVAPVTVGEKAIIGAGTVLTKDAPDKQLTVARSKQISIENWQSKEE